RARGTLKVVQPLMVRPRNTLVEVHVDRGAIRLEPDLVTVDNLSGALGGGTFGLNGTVQLAHMRPVKYNLHLRGNDLPVHTKDLVLEANVTADALGEGPLPLLKGRVDIIRGRYLKKLELHDFNFVARQPDTGQPLAKSSPWLRDLRLDVVMTSTSGVDVSVDAGAFAVQANLETDLRITGNALAPHIDGKIAADRGHLRFPKADLQITQAVVDFVPTPADPIGAELSLLAEGEVTPVSATASGNATTYGVSMRLDGTPEKLNLDLQSDKGLGRLEVLALLTTGHANLAELTQGGGGAEGSKMDAAIAFAGSQVSGPLAQLAQQQLERMLNLRVELGAEVTQERVRVTAAKSVNSRLRLEGAYSHGLSAAQSTVSTRAQLSLTDRLLLEGKAAHELTNAAGTGSAAEGGVRSSLELKYRLMGN
ncbi:MAG TPA: translocation/assembly module TamB domain-containing protein, partial [Myxococcota bacterium]|nr:translocation/assembly module TamB domain-containing protein [Myxococcota bacterium]